MYEMGDRCLVGFLHHYLPIFKDAWEQILIEEHHLITREPKEVIFLEIGSSWALSGKTSHDVPGNHHS